MKDNRSSDIACDHRAIPARTHLWPFVRSRLDVRPSGRCGRRLERRTRRRVFQRQAIGIWLVLSALLLTGFAYQPGAVLHTSPQTTHLKVGDTTTIDLMLKDVHGLYGVEIHLAFDPQVLEVVDAAPETNGIQLEPGTLPAPDFVVQNEVDNGAGTIDYAVTQLPPSKPGQGSGVVARVTFRAKKPSVSLVRFDQFLLADTIGGNIDALPQDGQIKVQSRSSWILYATAAATLTLALGSIGYLVTRRK